MIRTLYRHRSGTVIVDLPEDQLPTAAKDPQSRLWIDMQSPTMMNTHMCCAISFTFIRWPSMTQSTMSISPKWMTMGTICSWSSTPSSWVTERMDIETREMDILSWSKLLDHATHHPSPNYREDVAGRLP